MKERGEYSAADVALQAAAADAKQGRSSWILYGERFAVDFTLGQLIQVERLITDLLHL